ncbi:uncharacterized protein LODBEIA_P14440 [Lodderomyces beijingensis]|uniref:Transporter protein SMF2 n=1 Tax=Lodderomyces beijingensis TaxID=1775926 RepID=A0ABP0ZJ36_9ASCO
MTSISNAIRCCNIRCLLSKLKKYSKFIGPGLMVSVAFLDPGNYSTAVSAGSAYKYNLLFSILLSNCLAIFLQALAAKLGAVTGLDLAANCKNHFTFKTNVILYIMTEIAIIATDLAEVVGTAIALNILFKIPLFLGVIVTVIDVLIVLAAYRPKGPLLFIRIFESFVSILVAATVVCFGIQLYQVSHDDSINFSIVEVMRGFLPNEDVVDMSEREGGNGLFLSLAILGATVMPHSLYLGSGLVQARLKDFDIKNGFYVSGNAISRSTELAKPGKLLVGEEDGVDQLTSISPTVVPSKPGHERDDETRLVEEAQVEAEVEAEAEAAAARRGEKEREAEEEEEEEEEDYRPSIHAIKNTMTYTMVELVVSLFTVALFVNSAILIVAGATLQSQKRLSFRGDDHDKGYDSGDESDDDYENADLFTIYHLLSKHLSPTAGFVFALALLCSGQSAGVVCTLAGQMVSEGFLSWSLPPVTRRLITRGLAIAPCLFVVVFAGREGLAKTLNASQVVLSLLLPIVSAPLIWFTCDKQTMRVPIYERDGDEDVDVLYNADDEFFADNFAMMGASRGRSKRFASSEPAIRLKDLRNSHPCAGWDEDDDDEHHHQLLHTLPEEENILTITSDRSKSNSVSKPYSQLPQRVMKSRSNSVSCLTNELSDSSVSSSSSSSSSESPVFAVAHTQQDEEEEYDGEILRIKGYKDFSNSTLTSVCAILIWAFITMLNLYLVVNMFSSI